MDQAAGTTQAQAYDGRMASPQPCAQPTSGAPGAGTVIRVATAQLVPSAGGRKVSAPKLSASGLSIRAFAEKDGCDEKLVRRALQKGRLTALSDGKLDPALVGTGWRKSTRRVTDAAKSPADNSAAADTSPADNRRARAAKVSAPTPGDVLPAPEVIEQADEFIRQVLRGEFATIGEAERVKENGLALKHMLDGLRKARILVPYAAAEAAFFEAARDNRDAWMGWVGRIAVTAAAELGVDARQLTEVLTVHVHQHLSELGAPEFALPDDSGEA